MLFISVKPCHWSTTYDEGSRDDDTCPKMPGDEKDVSPPPCLPSEIGSRVESIHVDLLAFAKPARDQGDHDGETGCDQNDKDSSDV